MPIAKELSRLSFYSSNHVNTLWLGDDNYLYDLYAGDIANLIEFGVVINKNEMNLDKVPREMLTYKGRSGLIRMPNGTRVKIRRFRFQKTLDKEN